MRDAAFDSGTTRPADPAGLRPHRLRWLTDEWHLVLPCGERLLVRGARRRDVDLIALMLGRCSEAMRLQALGSAPGTSRRDVQRLVSTEVGLVVVARRTRAVALAALVPVDPGTAELVVVVEDEYQGEGLDAPLARHLAGAAWLVGYRRLRIGTTADDDSARRLVERLEVLQVEDPAQDHPLDRSGERGAVTGRLSHTALGALHEPGALVHVDPPAPRPHGFGPRRTPPGPAGRAAGWVGD